MDRCPSCGHCPHCGRSNEPAKTVPTWVPVPQYVPAPVYPAPVGPYEFRPPHWLDNPWWGQVQITCDNTVALDVSGPPVATQSLTVNTVDWRGTGFTFS